MKPNYTIQKYTIKHGKVFRYTCEKDILTYLSLKYKTQIDKKVNSILSGENLKNNIDLPAVWDINTESWYVFDSGIGKNHPYIDLAVIEQAGFPEGCFYISAYEGLSVNDAKNLTIKRFRKRYNVDNNNKNTSTFNSKGDIIDPKIRLGIIFKKEEDLINKIYEYPDKIPLPEEGCRRHRLICNTNCPELRSGVCKFECPYNKYPDCEHCPGNCFVAIFPEHRIKMCTYVNMK